MRRPNEDRVMRVSLDFLTKPEDCLIDRPRGDLRVRIPPDLGEQLLPVDDLAAVFGKVAQKFHLMMREVHDLASRGDALRAEIDKVRKERTKR